MTIKRSILAVVVAGALISGCGNRTSSDPNGTPSTYTVKATPDQLQAVENDPNIPPDRKAGIIAALKGDKDIRVMAPTGAAPSYAKQGN